MLNPTEFSVMLKPGKRWLHSAMFIILILLAGTRLYDDILQKNNGQIIFGAILVGLGVFGILSVWRYRIVVTDGYIEQHGIFSSKRVMFTEVLRAKERKRVLYLDGSTQTVRILPDIDRRDEVAAKISSKLNALPTLLLNGRTSLWSLADRDDEGRLVRR